MIDNYDKLPLGKFLELRSLDIAGMEEIDVQVSIISILSDMGENDIMNLPLPEYKKMAQKTHFLTTQPKKENKVPKKIFMDGKEYEVVTDVEKMTAGQYIDYQTYLGYKDEKYLPHILSTIIIPKGEKYGDTDILEVIKTIEEHLPISVAVSLSAFFLKRWQSLTRATLTYLILRMKWMKRREKNMMAREKMEEAITMMTTLRTSIKNGDGLDLQ